MRQVLFYFICNFSFSQSYSTIQSHISTNNEARDDKLYFEKGFGNKGDISFDYVWREKGGVQVRLQAFNDFPVYGSTIHEFENRIFYRYVPVEKLRTLPTFSQNEISNSLNVIKEKVPALLRTGDFTGMSSFF